MWIAFVGRSAHQVVEALRMLRIDGDAAVEVLVGFLVSLRSEGREAFCEVLHTKVVSIWATVFTGNPLT